MMMMGSDPTPMNSICSKNRRRRKGGRPSQAKAAAASFTCSPKVASGPSTEGTSRLAMRARSDGGCSSGSVTPGAGRTARVGMIGPSKVSNSHILRAG